VSDESMSRGQTQIPMLIKRMPNKTRNSNCSGYRSGARSPSSVRGQDWRFDALGLGMPDRND
jgi:hypothetical protein